MSGVYGDINSRADFLATLDRCLGQTWAFLQTHPNEPTHVNIVIQLDAMKRWSQQERTPTEEERGRVDVGLVAVREFEPADTLEVYLFMQDLQALNNYFEDWPTDEQAASATDDDFFEA